MRRQPNTGSERYRRELLRSWTELLSASDSLMMYGGDFSEMTENIADLTVEDFTEMADNIADLTVEDVRRHFYNRSADQASPTNNSLLSLSFLLHPYHGKSSILSFPK